MIWRKTGLLPSFTPTFSNLVKRNPRERITLRDPLVPRINLVYSVGGCQDARRVRVLGDRPNSWKACLDPERIERRNRNGQYTGV
jgi:hypothetical protein